MLVRPRSVFMLFACLLVAGTATIVRAERCNFFPHNPGGCGCFNLVIAGNVTGTTNICQTCGDPTVNGFAKCPSASCSMSFDGTNTTITYCGSCGLPANPHFGADGGTGNGYTAVGGYWTNCGTSSGGPQPIGPMSTTSAAAAPRPAQLARVCTAVAQASREPIRDSGKLQINTLGGSGGSSGSTGASEPFVSVVTDQNPGPNPVYFVVYVRGTSSTGEYLGTWFADAYAPGANVLTVNNTSSPITRQGDPAIEPNAVRASGNLTSLADIHQLNFCPPAPLNPDGTCLHNTLTPVSSLAGTVLQPGGSVVVIPAP